MVNDPDLPPISAPFTISSDKKDNVWLYLGTGRFQTTCDKTDSLQNYLVGVKDPFYNARAQWMAAQSRRPSVITAIHATDCAVTHDDLFYSNPYVIKPNNVVTDFTAPAGYRQIV